jgi:TetR/AcrR family transcriptional regulator, tetracycline repressor protein
MRTGARGSPLNRERVVDAALTLVDRDGLDTLTMRRLGRELGVEAMSLYEYLASKDELLTAVAERVLSELDLVDDPARPWQARVRSVIDAWARLAENHPGAFVLLYRSRRITVEDLMPAEIMFAALSDAGFQPLEIVQAYRTLVAFVDGVLLSWRLLPPAVGPSDYNAGWRRAVDAAPPELRVFREIAPYGVGVGAEDIWEDGIDLLLRGLEARLTGTAPGAG